MTRLQLNLNPSNWLVLEYFGLLNGVEITTASPTSTTAPKTPKPPTIPQEVINSKIALKTEINTRLRKVKNIYEISELKTVQQDFNLWDRKGFGHLRGKTWEFLLEGVIKDTKKADGDDTNFAETEQNLFAGTTEYFLITILRGDFGINSINDKQKKTVIEEYMKKYTSAIDKAFYNDDKYKPKIEALGLTVPTL